MVWAGQGKLDGFTLDECPGLKTIRLCDEGLEELLVRAYRDQMWVLVVRQVEEQSADKDGHHHTEHAGRILRVIIARSRAELLDGDSDNSTGHEVVRMVGERQDGCGESSDGWIHS